MEIYEVIWNCNSDFDYDGSFVKEQRTACLCLTNEIAIREMQKLIDKKIDEGWTPNKNGKLESPEGYTPESDIWYEIKKKEIISK